MAAPGDPGSPMGGAPLGQEPMDATAKELYTKDNAGPLTATATIASMRSSMTKESSRPPAWRARRLALRTPPSPTVNDKTAYFITGGHGQGRPRRRHGELQLVR